MRIGTVAAIAISVTASAGVSAQSPQTQQLQPGTSTVAGKLTDAFTKVPIANCSVRALPVFPGSMHDPRIGTSTTGPDGSFGFAGIAEGNYQLLVDCPTHVTWCLRSDPNGSPCTSQVTLRKDQQRLDVNYELFPAATVRGRVVDSAGMPVAGATVRIGGSFGSDFVARAAAVVTKDDGTYELRKVLGGSWRLEVDIPPPSSAMRSPTIYYPGVLERGEASPVEVVTGKESNNVDITVPAVIDRTLTVRVTQPDAMTSVAVSLIRGEPLMTRKLEIDAEGRVDVKGLIAGRYFVTATALSDKEPWVAYQAIDWNGTTTDVSLQMQRAGRIRGRFVGDGGRVPSFSGATICGAWIDGDVTLNPIAPDEGPVAPDGTFEIDGVFGYRRLQLCHFDPGWRIQSVLQGSTDVTTAGIDVSPGVTTEVTVVLTRR